MKKHSRKPHEVQHRAYFLSQQDPSRSPEENWLLAEAQCKPRLIQYLSPIKPFWDWLGLQNKSGWDLVKDLSLPLLIFLAGAFISSEGQKDKAISEYLKTITSLKQESSTTPGTTMANPIDKGAVRALTLAVLDEVGTWPSFNSINNRRERVARFLIDSNLLWPLERELSTKTESRCTSQVGLHFEPVRLDRANLSSINLNSEILRGLKLFKANLSHSSFFNADFSFTDLREADLSQSSFRRATLCSSQLGSAKASGSDFRGADLIGANGPYARFSRSDIRSANFTQSYMPYAEFIKAESEGAIFNGADLEGAQFTNATLKGADFKNANLKGADFRGSTIDVPSLRKQTNMLDCAVFDGSSPVASNSECWCYRRYHDNYNQGAGAERFDISRCLYYYYTRSRKTN